MRCRLRTVKHRSLATRPPAKKSLNSGHCCPLLISCAGLPTAHTHPTAGLPPAVAPGDLRSDTWLGPETGHNGGPQRRRVRPQFSAARPCSPTPDSQIRNPFFIEIKPRLLLG